MPSLKTDKELIIRHCIPFLEKQGCRPVSMSALAKACDIRVSHFYYYFDSKEHLLLEILRYLHLYFRKSVMLVVYPETGVYVAKTTAFCQACENFFLRQGGMVLATALPDATQPEVTSILKAFFSDFTDCLLHLFQENTAPGIALENAEQAVQDILGSLILVRVFNNEKYLKTALWRLQQALPPLP